MENIQKRITLKKIAHELGFSISTVSKALKNSSELSNNTKETIHAFAELHNYKPNQTALSLRIGHTKNIGVIFPSINNSFFSNSFCGIEKFAADKEYNVTLCISDECMTKEMKKIQMLTNLNVAGFIICLSAETKLNNYSHHIKEITKHGTPLVLFERIKKVNKDKAVINNIERGYLPFKRLIDREQNKNALITTEKFLNSSEKFANGDVDTLSRISQPEGKLGKIAAKMLIEKIGNQQNTNTRMKDVINTAFIESETAISQF